MDDTTNQKQFQPVPDSVAQSDQVQPAPIPGPELPSFRSVSSTNTARPMSAPREVRALGGRIMQPQTNPIVAQSVSAPANKEHEPTLHSKADVDKMTEPEIAEEEKAVERKIEEIVEESPDTEKPKLPEEVKKAGVELAKESAPMPSGPSGKVVLPMTYEEAVVARKTYKWRDSISWLASVILYHFKKLKRNPLSEDKSGFG